MFTLYLDKTKDRKGIPPHKLCVKLADIQTQFIAVLSRNVEFQQIINQVSFQPFHVNELTDA
jgi:hypothetical protein